MMLTGAGGMLAQALAPACALRGHEVVPLRREQLDITDAAAVEAAISDIAPDAVLNCAAWTDVDGAERDEAAAMRVNDEAAAVLASAAASRDARILLPSTDYVFDGAKRRPYVELDSPSPLNAYGRSKLGGETSVAVANPRHFIVRTSWLFGMGGGNFVETMLTLGAERPEVLVVADQVGSPTWTGHLAVGLVELVEGEAFGIHHVAASGQCSWYEFANEIFDQAGVECDVLAATTEMMGRAAPRPAYSALTSERSDPIELPHWRRGLAAYLGERTDADPAPEPEAQDVRR